MAGYVKNVDTTIEFDGQQVQVKLRQLEFADLILLRKDDQAQIVREYAQMLPRYVIQMSPILDSDRDPVPMEVITSAAYFAPLVGSILRRHVDAAGGTTNPPSAGQSEG